MVRVLIFGASGFIGKGVALALIRSGHYVIGQTRSETQAIELTKCEIEPFISDTSKESKWIGLIPELDAIIDCMGGNDKDESMKRIKIAEEFVEKSRPDYIPKLIYIKTSGTWLQGTSSFEAKSDGSILSDSSPKLAKWLLEQENLVKQSKVLNGIVIRPSLLIGGNGSLLAPLFTQTFLQKRIDWPGYATSTIQTIHIDDLAECFKLAIEKATFVKGLSIDCTNPMQESVYLLVNNLAKLECLQSDKVNLHPPTNEWEECLITGRPLRPIIANSLLGWQAKKPGLNDGLKMYYQTVKAHYRP